MGEYEDSDYSEGAPENSTMGALSNLFNPGTTKEAQEVAKKILGRSLSNPYADEENKAFSELQASSEKARQALREARERILARRYDPSIARLAASAGLLSPTRSGSFSESLGNAAQNLIPIKQQQQQFQMNQDQGVEATDLSMSDLDKQLAQSRLNLIGLQRKSEAPLATESLRVLGRTIQRPFNNISQEEKIARGEGYTDDTPENTQKLHKRITELTSLIHSKYGFSPENSSQIQDRAKMVANYDLPPPSTFEMARRPEAVELMNQVKVLNPEYQSTDYPVIQKTRNTFATDKRIAGLNTAFQHLKTADELADAWKAGKIKLFNQIASKWAEQTGNPEPTNLNGVAQLVGNEVIKATVNIGAGTGSEREHAGAQLTSAASPEQMHGATTTLRKLLLGQVQSLENQYKNNAKRSDFRQRFLLPDVNSYLTAREQADKSATLPKTNGKGWKLKQDGSGNLAYVGPNGEVEEVQ